MPSEPRPPCHVSEGVVVQAARAGTPASQSTRGMHVIRFARRTVSAALTVATLALLAPTTAALAAPATDDPVAAAAGYLAGQFTDDPAIATEFGPSAGQTIDAVLGLDAAGHAGELSASATAYVAGGAEAYASWEGTWYAGSLGKLLLLAGTRPELDAGDVGGVDARATLEGLECAEDDEHCEDWEVGNYRDAGDEFPSTTNQAYAVLGLAAVDTPPSDAAVAYLAGQACDEGGFQHEQRAPDEACSPDVDVTALAIQALQAVGAGEQAAASVGWLAAAQDDGGGFGGTGPTEPVNANSTGLAVQALLASGEQAAADAGVDFLLSLQAGCEADEDERGAIRYAATDEEADAAGGGPVWATAQALPALAGVTLDAVSGDGAAAEAPVLDCDDDASDDEADAPADGDEPEDGDEPADDVEAGRDADDEAGDGGDASDTGDESDGTETESGAGGDATDDADAADDADGTDGTDGSEVGDTDHETEVVVSETGDRDELARTGVGLGGLAGIALALVLTGLLALRLRPRYEV